MTGRNDPCPCGSGKKYKKCCLAPMSPDVLDRKDIKPPCRRCGVPTLVMQHKTITPKLLRQPYYYFRWWKCRNPSCKTKLIMPEQYKVYPVGTYDQAVFEQSVFSTDTYPIETNAPPWE